MSGKDPLNPLNPLSYILTNLKLMRYQLNALLFIYYLSVECVEKLNGSQRISTGLLRIIYKNHEPGSLHVYLIDLDIDLRGVMVCKRKESWFFGLPSLFGKDPDTGKKVRFPVFSFVNREKTMQLRELVTEKGKQYIIKNFLESNNPEKTITIEKDES